MVMGLDDSLVLQFRKLSKKKMRITLMKVREGVKERVDEGEWVYKVEDEVKG